MALVINYFSAILNELIKESLIGVLETATKRAIEDLINSYLINTPPKTDIYDGDLEIDLDLLGYGVIVSSDWLAIPLDGSFHTE